jgi:hypothetical protein
MLPVGQYFLSGNFPDRAPAWRGHFDVDPAEEITEIHVRDKCRGAFVPGVVLGAVGD